MPSLSDESFDSYAADYEDHLAQGLRLSGESSDYFAQKRIRLVCEVLEMRGESPRSILDYGCGTGNATPFLRKELAPEHIVSVDPSRKSIETLKKKYAGPDLTAIPLDEYAPREISTPACATVSFITSPRKNVARPPALSMIPFVRVDYSSSGKTIPGTLPRTS